MISPQNLLLNLLLSTFGSLIVLGIDYGFSKKPPILPQTVLVGVTFFIFYLVIYKIQKRYIFPSYSRGTIPYNTNINATEFSFPYITEQYKKEVFLVGPNQNFLLNMNHNEANLLKLIHSLDHTKKVKILISDIRNQTIRSIYSDISTKDFEKEATEILSSINDIDDLINMKYGAERLEQIKTNNLLQIKCTKLYLDSFCFVDSSSGQGKGYFMLVTKDTPGGTRPIFYFSEMKDQDLFNFYYDKYYRNIFEDAEQLWPQNNISS